MLIKNKVDIILSKGINTKLDNKLTLNADLLTLENRVFEKQGTLSKRKGYDALSNRDTASNALSGLTSISTFRRDQLILTTNNTLYSYAEGAGQWVNKDTYVSGSASIETAVRNTSEQSNIQAAAANGMIVYAWEDTRGGIRYSVQDELSKSFLISDVELVSTGNGDSPRLISVNNNVVIFYGDVANLKYHIISSGSPTSIVSSGTARTDLGADHIYDVVVNGSLIYVLYKTNAGTPDMELAYFNANVTIQSSTTISETIDDVVALHHYTATTGTTYFIVGWKEDADNIKAKIYNSGLVEIISTQTIDSTIGTDIEKMTIGRLNSTTDTSVFYYHVPDASSNSNDYIVKNTLTLAGTAGTRSVFARSVGIATDAFLSPAGDLYVGTLHESELQSTMFVLDSNGDVAFKYYPGNAGNHESLKFPSPVFTEESGKISFAINTKGRLFVENATLFSLLGVSKASIDFDSDNGYNNVSLNDNLFMVGGILSNYDGQSITEQGFHLYPEVITEDATATTGGSMSDGTYSYIAIYEWTDNLGNRHRSAPSPALNDGGLPPTVGVTLSSGGSTTQTVTIGVPTLRLTKKDDTRNDITIELYRTENNGTIFYKVTTVNNPVYNDKTVDTVQIVDTTSDVALIYNEPLYTTGGVLENISAPSCDIVAAHNNRLFIAGLPDRNKIRYSKQIVAGEALGFNEALEIALEPKGGNVKALASMDSNLVIFKEDNIYVVNGDGPNALGLNGSFTEPQLIATDTGCKDTNSVVLGPNGLYFKSKKGIYLLTRSLQAQYIGAPVEDYNNETITSAQLLDDVNEIRFTTSTGTLLVHNYYFNQWSVFTNKSITDSVIWQNNYLYIDTSDNIFQESDGFLDGSTFVDSKIGTGWIPIGGLQGFQRAYRVAVLGAFKSNHLLKVRVYTDYNDTIQQEVTFDTGAILSSDSDNYGDGIYGVGTPFGGSESSLYQFQVHLKRQKCQAIRIEVEEIFENDDLGSNTGEGMEITGISLQIGSKQGFNKQRQTRKS